MARIAFTRDLFLWMMSIIYLFAFSSLYVQIPGLYGDNGILPARLVMEKEAESLEDLLKEPSLLKLTPRLGLDTQTAMDFLSLAGIALSLYAMLFHKGRNCVVFAGLWVLYLSLYQVGQTFLWFQWDILLLETGFLTLLVAPMTLPFVRVRSSQPHDYLMLWLVRWLLFRLMFASGVVKLTSQCPTWWGLTALNIHFESQCIPTPLAWYWHQLPEWFLRLGVVATYIIEIPLPFLFFSPVRSLRVIAFYAQVLLQLMIILTGNYNFFNLLTIALCIPLLDDEAFFGSRKKGGKKSMVWNLLSLVASVLLPGVILGLGVYYTIKLFTLRLGPNYSITSKIAFTEKQFVEWLEMVMPWTIRLGAASLALELLQALVKSMTWYGGIIRKNISIVQSLLFGTVAVAMFGISLVPHTAVLKPLQRSLDPTIISLHGHTRPLHLVSSYGLFRRMTGVGGRPEVVIEGSYDRDGPWQEYNFLYKPGNLTTRPPVVAPHQPRLDWQMWFAALSNYQNNPWLVTLLYRLLTAQPEVLQLMADQPFPLTAPPKFIRATLYHYHYTTSDPKSIGFSKKAWWWREKKADYVPVMSANVTAFQDFLKHYRILEGPPKTTVSSQLGTWVQWVRKQVGQPEGFTFCMSLFGSGLFINILNILIFG